MTAAEVVEAVGLHPSTVRAHLEQLVDAGLLMKARASDGAPGRPAWRYRGAAADPAPAPYRTLAAALLDHLATEGPAAAVRAGQAWGRRLATGGPEPSGPVDAALSVLQGLGFDPSSVERAGETEIHLHTCPFLDLVGNQPDVMCGLHAGMVRGVIQSNGAPEGEVLLEPFAGPTSCVVRVRLEPTRRRRS
jgi:predicted ArsR family transcriptional regulator